jgi:hypothetical protein
VGCAPASRPLSPQPSWAQSPRAGCDPQPARAGSRAIMVWYADTTPSQRRGPRGEERMVQQPQGAIPFPQIEILEDCCSRWEILWQSAPLTARSENIQDRVRHLAHVRRARTPASLRSPDMRRDQGPSCVGQIGRVAKPFAFIPAAVPRCPHRAPPAQVPDTESQPIPKTQLLSQPTLRERRMAVGFS